MSTKPVILIATLMAPRGWCGVQTHFNAIAAYAVSQGIITRIVEPNLGRRYWHKLARRIGLIINIFDREHALLWHRYFDYFTLKRRLERELRSLRNTHVTIYAQDPLSALAALHLRFTGHRFRLVMVAHFNISEAHEQITHGYTSKGKRLYTKLMDCERTSLPNVDALIFVSDYMQCQVAKRLPEIARIPHYVIPNFTTINPGEMPKLQGDLVSIGTLEPRKNQSFLLQTLAAAARKGKIYTLTLIGDGASRRDFEALAKKLGVAGQVRFLGNQAQASRYLASHRVYVHGARMESFPIALLEALAAGRPILAAPVGGIPEIFKDGVEGLYWDLDDPAAAADLLTMILESPNLYSRMANAALNRFHEQFAAEHVAPRWLSVLIPSNVGKSQVIHDSDLESDSGSEGNRADVFSTARYKARDDVDSCGGDLA